MWIRSQDKETLLKVDKVSIEYESYISGNYEIIYKIKSNDDILGKYKTKEVALNILDNIQNGLCYDYAIVYNMPEYDIELEEL
jgi:hypothetical protein